ncbi:MAG: peptidoglycan bridge formation glycyltransferase FemA/FemB family protein [Gammaproteobacteria bacterium]|nr:peptidoglycan bridge formation glycyltransferase FemA/FemB family protein [Gammaproteobacteria bacterium]
MFADAEGWIDNVEEVRITSPAPRDTWWQLVESDPLCFMYQTPTGIDAICAAHNAHDESRLYEFPDGRRLLLPLYRSRLAPVAMSSLRSPKIGGVLAGEPVRASDLRAILADLAALPNLRRIVRPTALQSEAWIDAAPEDVSSNECVSHVLELDEDFTRVFKEKFNSQARRAVRKGEKAGLQIEHGDARQLLTPFYELLERSIDRWAAERGQPLLLARWRSRRSNSLERLRRTFGTFGDACRIWLASVDGKPAAGIIVLFGRNAHYTRGAMDKDLAGPSRASFLLQKLAIEEACSRGCRYYNMGESGSSDSLARFKRHFGATEYHYPEYRFERLPVSRWESGLRGAVRSLLSRRNR